MASLGRGIVLSRIDRLFGEGTLTGLGDGPLLERYVTRRDGDAFAALVDIHGPMVLGLCRRMLRDPRDVEDAFQATFLVLVRKAPAIRDRTLLGNWLYGVAFRVARRTRARTLRRRDREAPAGWVDLAAGPEPAIPSEAEPLLDQELNRLPEKYRAPLVLCYLRGRTHDQAAQELRCPVGTVRSRMARGRDLLRDRLTRRGFDPAALSTILIAEPAISTRMLVATVPPPLAAITVRTALAVGSTSLLKAGATTLALTPGVSMAMKLSPFHWVGVAVAATGLSAGGIAYCYAVQSRDAALAEQPAAAELAFRQAQQTPQDRAAGAPASSEAPTEKRLQALESKIEQLMERLGAPAEAAAPRGNRAAAAGPDAARPSDAAAGIGILSGLPSSLTATPRIRELEGQLRLAITEYENTRKLFERRVVSPTELEKFRGKVSNIAAQIGGIDDEIADEIELLNLELVRKDRQREKHEAQEEVAGAVTARNKRLNERKPGMVSSEDTTKAEAEVKIARADVGITKAEIAEIQLRIAQLVRRRDRLKEIRAVAQHALKDEVPAQPAGSSRQAPARSP